ncbi:DNA N-6-adenine-methyltransferase [Agrobacterium pusense]|uniref:DNA N-6-adenine-methyltransferase n=1 Tax=Agrobacterium TaxID=357 RepID=UPI000D3AE71A|nr:DNA N-6-adenine-methyltransferase [Agrobacterium pusense]PTV72495.1 hypothetical protein DBL06_20150 [Agrobacterium pusense]
MGYWDQPGAADEWFTPKHVFDALGAVFDTDVASPKGIKTFVPATRFIDERSLEKDWHGFVWMNPPFGGRNGLVPWLEKFFDHGNGIALVPDRTSAPWFREAWSVADLVLFTPKVRFHRPDGSIGKSPSNGTALIGVGEPARGALVRASAAGLGILAKPLEAPFANHSKPQPITQSMAINTPQLCGIEVEVAATKIRERALGWGGRFAEMTELDAISIAVVAKEYLDSKSRSILSR